MTDPSSPGAASVAVFVPDLDPARLPADGPACLRVLDPGLGGRLPEAERAALYQPAGLPMPPDTARRYRREMLQWVDTVRKPGDLLYMVGAADEAPAGLRAEMEALERFQRETGVQARASEQRDPAAGNRTKAQMVCILARVLEERLAEIDSLTERFGSILGSLKETLGVEPTGSDVPEEEHFLSSGIVEHVVGAGSPAPALPWRLGMASLLALLDPAVPLFTDDEALADVLRESGVVFEEADPAEAARMLDGWTAPDGVLHRTEVPGFLLAGRSAAAADKPWLDAPRVLFAWSRP